LLRNEESNGRPVTTSPIHFFNAEDRNGQSDQSLLAVRHQRVAGKRLTDLQIHVPMDRPDLPVRNEEESLESSSLAFAGLR
jgi:hypothetical protein